MGSFVCVQFPDTVYVDWNIHSLRAVLYDGLSGLHRYHYLSWFLFVAPYRIKLNFHINMWIRHHLRRIFPYISLLVCWIIKTELYVNCQFLCLALCGRFFAYQKYVHRSDHYRLVEIYTSLLGVQSWCKIKTSQNERLLHVFNIVGKARTYQLNKSQKI